MPLTTDSKEVPVRLVGSSVYGRYSTVSAERTYNMYITSSGDGEEQWLVNFPGYQAIIELVEGGAEGRGLFHSVRGNFLLAVVASEVFLISDIAVTPVLLGTMASSTGEVFFDGNLDSQIYFCTDQESDAYIYNYLAFPAAIGVAVYTGALAPSVTDLLPNYVTYQNTYFIVGNALTNANGSNWYVFESGYAGVAADAYKLTTVTFLALQTKPDFAKAAIRIPAAGNNLLVFGSTVAEIWTQVPGLAIYQRQSSINIDFGVASVATIAANDEAVVWLGINEKSSAALMVMRGGQAQRISTDGLDHLLDLVQFPTSSTAFMFREDGHLFYVLTFFDDADDFSIVYDLTTSKLYDVTDWDFTSFPARQIVYFGNETYFISKKDGGLYKLSTDLTQYDVYAQEDGETVDKVYDIPCVRVSNTFRVSDRPEKYKIKMFTFVIESGTTEDASDEQVCEGYLITEDTGQIIYTEDDIPMLVEGGYCYINRPRVDLTISKNGGISYSNTVSYDLKASGQYRNQPRFNNLGYAQQITYQMRIWGKGRKVLKNGTMEIGG